ncbi:hypothetical protein T12_3645 [Trichinella patagoniensis]|uniref:Uncharacterized protein n=1 Tax=Trichinella patagoniensis TaxID=990121 RepID=A0A0V0WJL0_9BILA|nr:hypothetical protein T12_3645 [Trichinella patagoniensis]
MSLITVNIHHKQKVEIPKVEKCDISEKEKKKNKT